MSMLVFLLSFVSDWTTVMFQPSGFYREGSVVPVWVAVLGCSCCGDPGWVVGSVERGGGDERPYEPYKGSIGLYWGYPSTT